MRIIKHSFIVILILGGLVLIVNQAFLYSSNTTHPYLTEQIVKFYNYYYDPDITPQQLEQMENGSIHEDFGDRSWWYHFYDPIYNVGTGGLTAKAWAQNPEKQVGIPGGDHSWQTAIKDYNVGYKQKAFYSLGHILHLIEDMAVPAHTRNDTHYNGGDPLENWAGNLPKDSTFYNIAQPLIDKGVKPKNFNNLNTYFDELANFSNRNFFSKQSIKDTIVESRYSRPKIVKEIFNTKYIGYAYGKIDDYTRLIRLLKIEKDDRGNKTYFLDDTTPEIHADYFSILSKEAVINGAGVVKLFFDNITEPAAEIVEPEKQLSFWQKIGNSIAGGVKFVISVVDGLIHAPYSAIESAIEESILEVPSQYLTTGFEITKEIMNNVQDEPEVKPPISPQGGFTSGLSDNEAQEEKTFLVKKVIDGDTIVLDNGQEIRYIGIDAPEFPSGCFAQEATNKNKELLEGKQIRLEKDVSEVDKYGRLLRYVYLDLLFINDYLVRNGYVYDFAYEPDVKYKTQFVDAEKEAKENRRGLWGDICHPIVVQGQKTGVGGDVGISETLLAETQNQSQNQGSPSQPEQPSSPEEQSSASEGIPGDESFSSSSEGVQGDNQQPRDIMPPDVLINPLIYNYASSSLTIQWFSSEIPSVFFDIEYK